MALSPFIRAPQGQVLASVVEATDVSVSQGAVLAAANFPSEFVRTTQAQVAGVYSAAMDARVSQAQILVVAKGVTDNPKLRAWWFRLDGHRFYVLTLGGSGTVVLDLTTGQWSDWNSHGQTVWRAHLGCAWLGEGKATAERGWGTNIVGGDDRAGVLWVLDPKAGIDDGAAADSAKIPYIRSVTGIIPMKMRETARDAAVYLTLSLGQVSVEGAGVTLFVSDDSGKTYRDCGTVTIEPGNYTQECAWRGLGLIRAPMRIYRFDDQGATMRIAGAERR
jgi:hypothetical protein